MYTIPSAKWREDMLLLRETLGVNVPIARELLDKHGNPEAAFEAYTKSQQDRLQST